MLQGFGNATVPIEFIDSEGHKLVLPLLLQTPNDVDVLAGKILVDEKDSQRFRDAAAIQLCPGIHPRATGDRRPYAA